MQLSVTVSLSQMQVCLTMSLQKISSTVTEFDELWSVRDSTALCLQQVTIV